MITRTTCISDSENGHRKKV